MVGVLLGVVLSIMVVRMVAVLLRCLSLSFGHIDFGGQARAISDLPLLPGFPLLFLKWLHWPLRIL